MQHNIFGLIHILEQTEHALSTYLVILDTLLGVSENKIS